VQERNDFLSIWAKNACLATERQSGTTLINFRDSNSFLIISVFKTHQHQNFMIASYRADDLTPAFEAWDRKFLNILVSQVF